MQIDSAHINRLPSPSTAELPLNKTKKLIDNGLLHYEASIAGLAERYGRGETTHTIHVWWARRPHTAMRALVFASICNKTGANAEQLLSAIGISNNISDTIIEEARAFIEKQYSCPPKVLDMFSGGGTIPFESLNLGAETYAVDTNELSVFIQKCNLHYSQFVNSDAIKQILEISGERVLNDLKVKTDILYPLRNYETEGKKIYGYLWSYSTRCSACGYKYYLIKRNWLSKKRGRNISYVLHDDKANEQGIGIETVKVDFQFNGAWFGRNGTNRCPKCKHISLKASIKDCQDELVGMISPAEKTGKDFLFATEEALPDFAVIERVESEALKKLNLKLPVSELPVWSGIVNPSLYGIQTHSDFLNPRQRAVLLLLINSLHDEYVHLLEREGKETAIYVIGLLSSMIDQLVDWNCRLSMWIPQNEQVGRAFCGPGISMLWDYVEMDPVSNGPSNLNDKLKRIIKGSSTIKIFPNRAYISHAHAQNLPYENDYFDAIVTDPPYYDNIYYSVLSDFFYAWKRLLFKEIEPELFKTNTTEFKQELVASTKRSGNHKQAHINYCEQLGLAISEAARVLKPDGVFSFIYSHSSLNGWEALLKAYRSSVLTITSVQPLSIERKHRPRAMTSKAVNTCIVFVSRKTIADKIEITTDAIKIKMKATLEEGYLGCLIDSGWDDYDAALSVFAYGVGLIANSSNVKGLSDFEAMSLIEELVQHKVPSFKIVNRKSL